MDSYTLSNLDKIVHIEFVDREPSGKWGYTPARTTSFFGYFKRDREAYVYDRYSFDGEAYTVNEFDKEFGGYSTIDEELKTVFINYRVRVTFVNSEYNPKVYHFKTTESAKRFIDEITRYASAGTFKNLNTL